MHFHLRKLSVAAIAVLVTVSTSGCTFIFQKNRRPDVDKIQAMQDEVRSLKDEKSQLQRAKEELENQMSKEIADKEVKVEMLERGLVITFVAEVLFDSGKADLRGGSKARLGKVASTLNTTVKDLNVGIEGHTDNVPIKHSGWKSNWELSSARALSVLHYLIEEHKVNPNRLAATGYGQYKPVASNNSKEGRQKNRRVEIVILPEAEIEGR